MQRIWFMIGWSICCGVAPAATLEGERTTWHPLTFTFEGPEASAADEFRAIRSPNR